MSLDTTDTKKLLDAAVLLASEVNRINSLGGTLGPDVEDTGPGPEGWPSDEACLTALQVMNAAERMSRTSVEPDPEPLQAGHRRYTLSVACDADLYERWSVDLPGHLTDDALEEAAKDALSKGEATFIGQSTDGERNREILSIEDDTPVQDPPRGRYASACGDWCICWGEGPAAYPSCRLVVQAGETANWRPRLTEWGGPTAEQPRADHEGRLVTDPEFARTEIERAREHN